MADIGDVPRETSAQLARYVEMVLAENEAQNLISPATVADIWQRHVEDSQQLLAFRDQGGPWLDIGSGAGFPGMVLALLSPDPMTLCEPRRLRADFLRRAVDQLGLGNVSVVQAKAAAFAGTFDYITARAVGSLDLLFGMTRHLAHSGTKFILPRGRAAQSELAAAKSAWQGEFWLEQSLTSADAAILIARRVRRRGSR